ncbi:uncharacterized protein EI90DRAFT_3071410 [Cantharellus anzutake]|uniref:uncharacterized protein n=1 Tax=Cantharellus anzutake TaxID=1750568 RepID=UPI001908DB42|nr:uncharacterized protein EI90DRAFT_3071410 [Cantharellus anzutake]KAF8326074.1 hypothetical protein EI90DRAFT_3071410 [Cantharellus anzutake]
MHVMAYRLSVRLPIQSGMRCPRLYTLRLVLLSQYPKLVQSSSIGCAPPRSYATHRDTPSSLLSQQLERAARSNVNGPSSPGAGDSIGPFPLGVQSLNMRNDDKFVPWNELTPGGKVIRTTARATNFTVILLGASLSIVLTWALATELFARNSPTVLYGDACEKIKASPSIARYLTPPLSFHTTPPSSTNLPPRHRNRHPQKYEAVDAEGREHLLIHFWISSSAQHEEPSESWSQWISELEGGDFSSILATIRERATHSWESAKQAVAYVSGMTPTLTPVPPPKPLIPSERFQREAKEDNGAWSFLGMFKGMKFAGRSQTNRPDEDGTGFGGQNIHWSTAEVHADFVKDPSGVFQYRYLLVDVPNSKSRRSIRITVEKTDSYDENRDGVFLWQ